MSLTQFAPGLYKYLYKVCKFCIVTGSLLNISMQRLRRLRRLTYVIWMLTAILIVLGTLMGCSTINSTVENGVGQIPGQRVHVTTTVYRW